MDELTFRLHGVIKSSDELLADFVGPLDLILGLLSKNKMEIADLKISQLLEQYLAHIRESGMDLDMASEFTVMASHLVYLKSRMLLAVGQNQEDEDMALLLRALEERKSREEYEKIKIATAFLEPLSRIGRDIFSKPPEVLTKDSEYKRVHKPDELKRAMEELFERAARRAPPTHSAFHGIVGVEPYPVRKKLDDLLKRLKAGGNLASPFDGIESRTEMIATFLAILELCRESKISVEISEDCALTLKLKEAG